MPKILVQVWTEIDPTLNVRIDRASGQPLADEGDVLCRVSPAGRAAVAAATRIRDAEITAFAIGECHGAALRHALAAGASNAVAVAAECRQHAPGDECSSRLATVGKIRATAAVSAWVHEQNPALVIADRCAGLIAGQLGWSHLAGLEHLEIDSDRLQAIRQLGRGDREIVIARLPAVVRLFDDRLGPPYISRERIRSVASNRIRREALPVQKQNDANIDVLEVGPLQPVRPRTRLGGASQNHSARGFDRLSALMSPATSPTATPGSSAPSASTPEQMAEEFVRYLIHHQLFPQVSRDD